MLKSEPESPGDFRTLNIGEDFFHEVSFSVLPKKIKKTHYKVTESTMILASNLNLLEISKDEM